MVFIYSISCPITGFVKYIGKTKNPKERFRKHLSAKLKTAGSKWIFSLKEKSLLPIFEIIDEVQIKDWQDKEQNYIRLFKSFGAPLLNHTIGGEGGNTMGGRKLTKEQANKISLSKIGKQNPATSINNKLLKGSKIDQFDLSGNFINSHLSIKDAAKSINRSDRRIWMMVTGNGKKVNHVGGFVFKYSI
jgi:hypothetical protein